MKCPNCGSELHYVDDDRVKVGWNGDCNCYFQYTDKQIEDWNKQLEYQQRLDNVLKHFEDRFDNTKHFDNELIKLWYDGEFHLIGSTYKPTLGTVEYIFKDLGVMD